MLLVLVLASTVSSPDPPRKKTVLLAIPVPARLKIVMRSLPVPAVNRTSSVPLTQLPYQKSRPPVCIEQRLRHLLFCCQYKVLA